jgi:hypothetical protein
VRPKSGGGELRTLEIRAARISARCPRDLHVNHALPPTSRGTAFESGIMGESVNLDWSGYPEIATNLSNSRSSFSLGCSQIPVCTADTWMLVLRGATSQ